MVDASRGSHTGCHPTPNEENPMARLHFRVPRLALPSRASAHAGSATFRMMDVPDPEEAPGCSGWHESSRDLQQGLIVIEGPPCDPFDAWFGAARA
jgi:hypothetical protein